MAGTPVPAKNIYMTIDGLKLTDSYAREIGMTVSAEEIDASTLGDQWKQFLQGQAEGGFTVSGIWSEGTAAAELDAKLYALVNAGGTKLFEYLPGGSTNNKRKYSGNAFATSYEVSGAVGAIVGFSLGLKAAGSITQTIVV